MRNNFTIIIGDHKDNFAKIRILKLKKIIMISTNIRLNSSMRYIELLLLITTSFRKI